MLSSGIFSKNFTMIYLIFFFAIESLEYWHISEQYEWLEKDLKKVNRTETPWIIGVWHSPWYCTNHAHYNSGADMKYYFEDLLYQYKVDLILNGHVHAYESKYFKYLYYIYLYLYFILFLFYIILYYLM